MPLAEHATDPWSRNTTEQLIGSYLDSLPGPELEIANQTAEQIQLIGRPLASTVVIVPVAAAAEAPVIAHSLQEYAKQRTIKPFSAVLGFNIDDACATWNDPAVKACLHNAAAAQTQHPHLDIRSTFTTYTNPKIGAIRRNLWNGVLQALHQESGISAHEEAILINHDIDLMNLPTHWIGNIQSHFVNPESALLPAFGRSRHAFNTSFPNISRYVAWRDFFLDKLELSYEPAAAIPASFYIKNGGFNPTATLNEITSFTRERYPFLIRTGKLQTSPRRIISRLQVPDINMGEIWTADSFTGNDECRDPHYVAGLKDKDEEWLLSIIQSGVTYTYGHYALHLLALHNRTMMDELSKISTSPYRMIAPDELARRTEQQFDRFTAISQRVLRGCLGSRFSELVIDVAPHRDELVHQLR